MHDFIQSCFDTSYVAIAVVLIISGFLAALGEIKDG